MTKLPSFLQKPVLRPTVPPVEVEFYRVAQSARAEKPDRIIDCLGTLADSGSNSAEETKTSRVAELTGFALRGFGTFNTHIGTGVYGSELEGTLRRQASSSKPLTWAAGIRAPINNRIIK